MMITVLSCFRRKPSLRAQVDMARVFIICTATLMLLKFTNPSVIYHWIRGQGTFKLYLLKAVFEISDLLLKGATLGVVENFSRDF